MDDDEEELDGEYNPYGGGKTFKQEEPVAAQQQELVKATQEEYSYQPKYEEPAHQEPAEDQYKTAYESQFTPTPAVKEQTNPASSKLRFDDDDNEDFEYKPPTTTTEM